MVAEKKDQDFLLLSVQFCNKIDQHISLLALNEADVAELKDDTRLFACLFSNLDHYSTCFEDFTREKMNNMQLALSHLALACKNSKNYTWQMGVELGIEIPVHSFMGN